MEETNYAVTLDELKLFHGIDRSLYTILVKDLFRDPLESMQVMGLWLWLERGGFSHVVSKILSLPPFLISELADEAVLCLMCTHNRFILSPVVAEIPLTHTLVKKDISLQFFHENRLTISHEVRNLVSEVCMPALSDVMKRALIGGFVDSPAISQIRGPSSPEGSSMQNFSSLNIGGDATYFRSRCRAIEASQLGRTMFVTFSKGYPVSESEVRQFFARIFGNCLESFHMQEVRPDEQALYARIVFLRPSYITIILNGVNKAKFTINGKHVWMRKFVPRSRNVRPFA